jgi:hypothetical protein
MLDPDIFTKWAFRKAESKEDVVFDNLKEVTDYENLKIAGNILFASTLIQRFKSNELEKHMELLIILPYNR